MNAKDFLIVLFELIIPIGACCQDSMDSWKIVDYHVHVFSEELLDNIEKQGYSFQRSGFKVLKKQRNMYQDIEAISEDNQHAKMLLISAGYAVRDLESHSDKVERLIVERENDLLSDLVSSKPDQFIGFVGVHPLRRFSIEEIYRCHRDLGLHGIKLHLQGNKIDLEDKVHLQRIREMFQIASEEDIPLLVHNNAWNPSKGGEHARIFIDSILSEIDFLKIIFAHSGGGGGFQKYTSEFMKEFATYFETDARQEHSIYFELSSVVKQMKIPGSLDLAYLTDLIKRIGVDKFLFGSDYPVTDSGTYLRELSSLLELDDDMLKSIVERDIFEILGGM